MCGGDCEYRLPGVLRQYGEMRRCRAGARACPEPEPEPEKKSNSGMLLLVLGIALIGGGAGWYFKVYRPKHQQADQTEEDDGGDYPDYDEFEDDGPVGRGGRNRRKGGNQMNFTSSPFERMMKEKPRPPGSCQEQAAQGLRLLWLLLLAGDRLCVLLQGAFEGRGWREVMDCPVN